jgi:predicted  nucleic acid-binding Zn-ribbon protein
MELKDILKDIETYNQVTLETPESWMNNNKVGFPTWVSKLLMNSVDKSKQLASIKTSDTLFPHQRLIRDYLQAGSPYRGLLLYHGLGVGKTRTSIGVAELLLNSKNKEKALVILPASLRQNFIAELKSFGNIMYNKNNTWKLISFTDSNEKTFEDMFGKTVMKLFKKANKGVWLPLISDKKDKDAIQYKDLTDTQKKGLEYQIDVYIESRYEFKHYNGFTKEDKEVLNGNDEKKDAKLFDDKIVIIDEVHNLTSGLDNGKKTLKYKLYNKLFHSKNSSFVLLSGTPIINNPIEIAYTVNLLRGEQKTYSVELSGMPYDLDIRNRLKYVDMFSMKALKKNILFTFTIVPNDYKVLNGKLVLKEKSDKRFQIPTIQKFLKSTLETLVDIKGNKIEVKSDFSEDSNYALPVDPELFNKYFVDENNNKSKGDEIFKRRIMGSVSYYENYDKELYPTQLPNEPIELNMSDIQFKKYLKIRGEEIAKEKRAKVGSKSPTAGTYKIFSRAVCNFTFPEKIERPFPKSVKTFLMELDSSVVDEVDTENEVALQGLVLKDYQDKLHKALTELDDKKEELLKVNEGLEDVSPKYNAIINTLDKTNGTSIVYSDYRKVEGLKTMGLALEANGYSQLKVVMNENKVLDIDFDESAKFLYAKFSDPDTGSFMKEANEIILNIFNNKFEELKPNIKAKLEQYKSTVDNNGNLRGDFVKVLMITRSGAEGISLKNVRGVHILEPYWNNIRIDQVIGRANRTNSHIELPKSERNFTVYNYMMKFSNDQVSELSSQIKNPKGDNKKSSDQMIKAIADRKTSVIDGFLRNLKNASVDCAIHKKSHVGMECLTFKNELSEHDNAYTFNIFDEYIEKKEINSKKISVKSFVVQFKKIEKIKNKKFIYVAAKKSLYDFEVYKKLGIMDKVGTMRKLSPTQYEVSIISKK